MLEYTREEILNDYKSSKTPKLTLDVEDKEFDFSFGNSTITEMMYEDNEISAGSIKESNLSPEEIKQVELFAKRIDVADVKMLNSYGASAQKGISTFSTSIAQTVKLKDAGDVGASLRELQSAIYSTTQKEKKGILAVFQKGKKKIKYLVSNYENAESSIKKIEKDLLLHQQTLTKDIYIYDQMYDTNLGFYKELTMYILAGKKALQDAKKTKWEELRRKAEHTNDQIDVQAFRDYDSACKRFGKRLIDLETTRTVVLQTAPQIRMLQNADQEIVDKLRSDIINTIPLWRNQMLLALGIENSRRALDAQNAVTDMTNEMLRKNSEMLKQGAIDVAKASERGIVDIETLRKLNEDIITSINEVVRIHEEGVKNRAAVQMELAKLEEELKFALLETGSR